MTTGEAGPPKDDGAGPSKAATTPPADDAGKTKKAACEFMKTVQGALETLKTESACPASGGGRRRKRSARKGRSGRKGKGSKSRRGGKSRRRKGRKTRH
jgi:hypothetical protein